MAQIELPADLLLEVEQAAQADRSADQFVEAAVREKLRRERQIARLREIAGEIGQAIDERGITEEEILADFEAQREVPARRARFPMLKPTYMLSMPTR